MATRSVVIPNDNVLIRRCTVIAAFVTHTPLCQVMGRINRWAVEHLSGVEILE